MKEWTASSLDLGGELFPAKRRSRKPGVWKWIILVFVVFFFVVRSTRPVMRLRNDPPSEFFRSMSAPVQQPQEERQIAEAYWQVAVRSIQSAYSQEKPLPQLPPPEFRVSTEAVDLPAGIEGSRIVYWQQLRRVWDLPQAWDKTFEWNTNWVNSAFTSLQRNSQHFFDSAAEQLRSLSSGG